MGTSTRHIGDIAELTASFTLDGEPADPDEVTIRWRTPDGTISAPAATDHTDVGEYGYNLPLDVAGEWRWEFTGTGDAGGVQGGGFRVYASLLDEATSEVVCGVSDIEDRLEGRTLTLDEAVRCEALIAQLVDVLEIRLNRCLFRRQVTETHRLPLFGRLRLYKGPVRSITSITVDGNDETDPVRLGAWERAEWIEDVDIVVVYEAGDDVRPAVTGLVADAVTRTVIAGISASSGAIKSYSVEGTSITYGNVADGGQGGSGRLSVGDIRSIGRLRRPVLLT